jgi:hypothetical protein
MQDHPLPEMLRLSLQDLALRIKILKVKMGGSIEEVLSKALDPPLSLNIQRGAPQLPALGERCRYSLKQLPPFCSRLESRRGQGVDRQRGHHAHGPPAV